MRFPFSARVEGGHEAVLVELCEGLIEYEVDGCTGLVRMWIS